MLKGWSLIFYGTTQPIMKNDPISVPVPFVTNYPNNVSPSKSPGGKGNRKQQQQQQQKVAPFIILTPPRKGGKANQKNASGKNAKQKQQQQQQLLLQTTTRAPATTLYFNNGRKYEFINGVMSVNRPNSAASGGSGQSSSTIATQTLKVLNNNVDAAKGDKLAYAKVPIKAPKQVKAAVKNGGDTIGGNGNGNGSGTGTGTTVLPSDVELVDSFQFTSNPNIPKLFQQYEKIQEFYPEFHPYVGVAAKSPSTSNGSKPSRDGSKSYMNSPPMDAAGSSRTPQQPTQERINYAADADRGDIEKASQRYLFRDFALTPSPPVSATSKLLSTALLSTATKKASSQASSGAAGTVAATKTGKG